MALLPPPETTDATCTRIRNTYHHLRHGLCRALPPVGDTPDSRTRRDDAAISQVAALCPANAAEAALATQYVAANAQALEWLRLAGGPGLDHALILKYGAQSATMMRQAQGAMRLLLRAQAGREKRDGDTAATDRAAWTEHCVAELMAGAPPAASALSAASAQPAPPPGSSPESQHRTDAGGAPAAATVMPVAAEPASRVLDAHDMPASGPDPVPAGNAAPFAGGAGLSAAPIASRRMPPRDRDPCCDAAAADAALYECLYPERAALIRRLGRVPADALFGPPEDAVVEALLAMPLPSTAAPHRASLPPEPPAGAAPFPQRAALADAVSAATGAGRAALDLAHRFVVCAARSAARSGTVAALNPPNRDAAPPDRAPRSRAARHGLKERRIGTDSDTPPGDDRLRQPQPDQRQARAGRPRVPRQTADPSMPVAAGVASARSAPACAARS
jgi:hypothetical protein